MTHQQARVLIHDAFVEVFGREPTLSEMQCAQAVAWLETQYGDGWGNGDTGYGSFNMGAVQAGSSWKGATFEHKDSSPQPDGTSKWYVTKFRKYPTPQRGMVDLVRAVYQWHGREKVLAAATAGDLYAFSAELRASGYYEGFGATVAQRVANHHKAVLSAFHVFTKALGEPMPDDTGGTDPDAHTRATITIGSHGDDVRYLQEKLGLSQDGSFGPLTKRAVVQFQRDHHLTPDGWVGKQTWAALG